ncbi:hypothetical protein [Saccharicrinis aurantiacus]|nr:hypothetical protein [Saccharicrinis aurantiacus]
MEFLLQLFAELVINKEDGEIISEKTAEVNDSLENSDAEEFFSMMHFH